MITISTGYGHNLKLRKTITYFPFPILVLSAKKSLIVFTRYPEKGKTKTRLIPAIGAQKAADFQRQMTEYTMKTVAQTQAEVNLSINIFFNGGNLDLMQDWLGSQYHYQPQADGDLGQKMYSAFENSFKQGSQQVVIIGIDCPSLSTDILHQAFTALDDNQMVIGGADDGGYYLLGLTQLEKSLFENINWGTGEVFNQTMTIAQELNYTIYQLPVLKDIDRPEDLKFWHNKTKFR